MVNLFGKRLMDKYKIMGEIGKLSLDDKLEIHKWLMDLTSRELNNNMENAMDNLSRGIRGG